MLLRQIILYATLCYHTLFTHANTTDITVDIDTMSSMNLDELINLEVTLVSRQKESQFNAPAAIYVITNKDIRRSGLTSIPELLRLVPGLHVGKIDGNKWAINSRNTNSRFSDSMLVLMDGRTLYTPLFGGTYWDVQDTFLPDIERIEVIRGAGASLWGANAVSGIINIVTKDAKDTQNSQLYTGIGIGDIAAEGGARQGFQLSNGAYGRVYAKRKKFAHGILLNTNKNTDARDEGWLSQGGFRVDMGKSNHFRIQGDIYDGNFKDTRISANTEIPNTIAASGFNLLTTWSHQLSDSSAINARLYYDHNRRKDGAFDHKVDTYDFDFQHSFKINRHDITWGGGYRYLTDDSNQVGQFFLFPAARQDEVSSLFMQDRISLQTDQLYLILGSKFEHNDYTGFEYQPSIRLLLTPNESNTYWGAYTRAIRTPARAEADAFIDFNSFFTEPDSCPFPASETLGCVLAVGNSQQSAEIVHSLELGYRNHSVDNLSIDLALFNDRYFDSDDHNLSVNIHGVEVNTRYQATSFWRLEASYAYHNAQENNTSSQRDGRGIPQHSAQFRSYYNIKRHLEFDTLLYYTGDSDTGIEKYTRLDIRLGWKPIKSLELSFNINNLLDDVHVEPNPDTTRLNTGIERGYYLKGVLSF